MRNLSSLLRSLSVGGRGKQLLEGGDGGGGGGREAADAMVKEARRRKKETMLTSSGTVSSKKCNGFASVHSRRGEKGVNQDCCVVWEEFGCQEDMIFCGIFDGHGPWGHYVAKNVRESLPPLLLCNWQETLAVALLNEKGLCQFDIWKQSFLRTCATIDGELEHHRKLDAYNSGTTALTIVKQGSVMVLANVGDSRAVLATTSDDGSLVPVQLTIDFKPNLPQEAERITQCKGRLFCMRDEPGVHRVWQPNRETPGLATSRAFGDYCIKDFGVISVPEVTQRVVTDRDQFIVLATDGVWDVISNKEAVDIVSSTEDKGKSAKRLVQCAVRAWERKRRGIAVDDCSAICLFFHSPPLPLQV
ncbi:putative protein phosphatase 2C family protein [Iris pallida]|uniref:protein-serine/threonine phosphatase n=1 Tax=Iris pallida TaxID=29817 RepID=A0AAX6DGN0_IRIPA|nr:putative protein phosphatase 2C family protein [Iris pallida]